MPIDNTEYATPERTLLRLFLCHFGELPDPRTVTPVLLHDLMDILLIALCATLSGAATFTAMEAYGQEKQAWLQERLGLRLANGIPSHDTFGRLFANLDPEAFSRCFRAWTRALAKFSRGQIVAVDGKTLRRSFDSANGRRPLHLVSAWAEENRLVLGQQAVDQKSNEITAVPALLALLDLAGSVVTVDALNTQKAIAEQIITQGGDYVMALKDNHPLLHQEVADYFTWARAKAAQVAAGELPEVPVERFIQSAAASQEYAHGRSEGRRCWVIDATAGDWPKAVAAWPGLSSLVMVERERCEKLVDEDGRAYWSTPKVEQHYYLSSLPCEAKRLAEAVRRHWGIENRLHWVLDVAFGEDLCRVRKQHAAHNLGTLRHLALNLLRQENPRRKRGGIQAQRLRAGWSNDYLLHLLTAPTP